MLQFQQQAEIVTIFLFTLPPPPSPNSAKPQGKLNVELLHCNCNYVVYIKYNTCFCYYANYDPLDNSNTPQFGEKRNTKPKQTA